MSEKPSPEELNDLQEEASVRNEAFDRIAEATKREHDAYPEHWSAKQDTRRVSPQEMSDRFHPLQSEEEASTLERLARYYEELAESAEQKVKAYQAKSRAEYEASLEAKKIFDASQEGKAKAEERRLREISYIDKQILEAQQLIESLQAKKAELENKPEA